MRRRFVSVAAVTAAGPMAVTGLNLAAGPAPDSPRLTAASLPAASAGGQAPGSGSAAGAIVLVAVAVAAVGAFTVLQIMARSGRRRAPVSRGRARATCDWRTLPPQYQEDAGRAEMPVADHDGYGPLWRYGSPHGYARDYGPGHSPDDSPGYAPAARPPWSAPEDAPHERRS